MDRAELLFELAKFAYNHGKLDYVRALHDVVVELESQLPPAPTRFLKPVVLSGGGVDSASWTTTMEGLGQAEAFKTEPVLTCVGADFATFNPALSVSESGYSLRLDDTTMENEAGVEELAPPKFAARLAALVETLDSFLELLEEELQIAKKEKRNRARLRLLRQALELAESVAGDQDC